MKKLIACLLSALLLSFMALPIFAAAANAAVTVESKTASAGKTVDLKLNLSGNPGIAYLRLTVEAAEQLTLTGVTNGSVIKDLDQGVNLVWSADNNSTANGTLATLTFSVAANASPGDYSVSVKIRECYNENLGDVSVSAVSGKITVEAATPEKILTGISVATLPTKTVYTVGEALNPAGLTLTASYSTGETETVTSGFTCAPTALTAVGTQTVTVTYQGKTATFAVTVQAAVEKTLTGIAVKTLPRKMTYTVGETLDPTGLVITASYNTGETEDLTTGFSCSPTQLSAVGPQTITVSYQRRTTTFVVTVAAAPEQVLTLPATYTMNYKDDPTLKPTGVEQGTKLRWRSSDESVVSVDGNGKLTTHKKGTATITCETEDGSQSAECKVTVNYTVLQIIIIYVLFGFIWYLK
ncbi:MAG: bacterial Ig-like domain-containing protein [Clostridia bacterium]|nr:bacterial Ig-like domain-containing protein [Clostridia bacterium]